MSYRNMEEYDTALLNNIDTNWSIYFFCSYLYSDEKKNNNILINKIFRYNKIKNKIIKTISYSLSWIKILYYSFKLKPQAIHIQWLRIPRIDLIFIKILKRITGVNIVYTAHNVLPHNTHNKYKKIFVKIYSTVSNIIVHAEQTKNEIANDFNVTKNRIQVIPHGILNNINTNYIANKFKDNDHIHFLIIGGISKYKGITEFISVWKNTCKKNENFNRTCQLYILGKASDDYHIKICNCLSEDYSPNSIFYYNAELSDEDFNSYLSNCDVVVLPYIQISQSGVLLKSLSYKKPILVSDAGGLTQPLEVGYIGEKFSWDIKNAEEMLLIIFNNINISRQYYSSSDEWKKIFSFYSWEEIGKKTSDIYNRNTN